MEIDNSAIIRKHLDFIDAKLDRYIVHILRRPKDLNAEMLNALGVNESQRLIKTYYIDSLEYFDKKMPAIRELCKSNLARAYINVQPKDNFECILNLGRKILESIQNKNFSVKPEHLVRQAYSEWHKTRKKRWILDFDGGSLTEIKPDGSVKSWSLDELLGFVKAQVSAINGDVDDIFTVPTKNGHHIITPPFNLQEASKACSLLYEGEKTVVEKRTVGLSEHGEFKHKQVGLLHKDGLTLLYMDL